MKRLMIIVVGTVILVGAGMLIGALRNTPRVVPPQTTVPSAITTSLTSQTNTQSGVTITVTPKNITADAAPWDFEVSVNTHSVELSEDMAAVSALVDDSGKKYAPLAWKGNSPGGHHREGILSFSPISPLPRTLTLKIRAIGSTNERNFRWIIQ